MRAPRITVPVPAPGWDDLRAELLVPAAFPPDVLVEAEAAAAAPRLPDLDLTALPFLTIDPPDSLDLDQAMCLERAGDGFLVRYAIADVAAFVAPGGPLDAETHRRGETSYFPDLRVPLHPPVLAEGAASLLADQDRPAVVWSLQLDAAGALTGTDVRRALVRSRRKLDYASVQQAIDDGTADEQLQLLEEIGTRRQALARERDAVDLPTPEQEVTDGPDGRPCLAYRAPVACEAWNAQISLLTGMAAADLMLAGKVGLLRTLPPADAESVASLRRSALALGVAWPEGTSYGDIVSALDPSQPGAAALLTLTTRLLRGAAYTAFDGAVPEQSLHSAVAARYAHCTAPLRRLADRYVNEVCLALCAGTEVPQWARDALPLLPDEMAAADKKAHAVDRAIVDLAEALVLAPRVGEEFDAVVVESGSKGGVVQLADPAVRGRCDGADLPLGQRIRVRLTAADPVRRTVLFAPA
ncbi:MAG: RNB domain-containing ribonuclease [Actinobacteria bacterium]|nr:RNB domain-containing ribonuclease [Actinomycetota bacterium]